MRYFTLLRMAVVFGLVIAVCQSADAQNFRQYKNYDRYRYLPRLPERADGPEPLPRDDSKVTGDPKVLVDQLKGLVFLDHPDKVVNDKIDKSGIHVESDGGLCMLQSLAFHSLAESYLGGPISARRLNELVREIILFYRNNDQPVVDVSIPAEQDITDGTVQVVVSEARVGKVCVKGPTYFDPQVLANQIWIDSGDTIYESMLMEDLRWLYRNPFRTVKLELKPGENRGETDVIFNVEDKRPVRVYGGYDDAGSRFGTGLEQTYYGANWYNALNQDDQAGYQFTTSSDFNSLQAHSAFYSTALYNRDILTVYGSYVDFDAAVPGLANIFANEGSAWYLLGRWYRELGECNGFEHAVNAGIDLKNTRSGLEFFGVNVFNSETDIVQFMFGYLGKYSGEDGFLSFGIDGYASPGGLGDHNNDRSFRTSRAFATADYYYARGFAQFVRDLPARLQFSARVTGQISEGNLLQTEQLGLGGYNSIRGYDLYSTIADSGYFANIELRTQPIHLPCFQDECSQCEQEKNVKQNLSYDASNEGLVLLAFYDVGNGYNHNKLPGESDNFDLHSVGFGFRYKVQPHVSIRFDYGWQLSDLPLQQILQTPKERVHVGAWLAF